MKRIISNIILFVLSITILSCVYIGMFKISVTAVCILLCFFGAYGACMGVSWKSMGEIKKYEQKLIHFGLDDKDSVKTLLFSLITLLPTYFCVFLVSLVPIYTYEIWFLTSFPCIVLNFLPASTVLEEYRSLTRKKLPFLASFTLLVITCSGLGITISHLFFK